MIKSDNQIWKYSISNYNKSSNSAYYYCSDTSCNGKGTYNFNDEIKSEFEKKIGNKETFQITKEHTIEYSQHNYVINSLTSPGEGVTVFTSPYLSVGAPALGEAKGLMKKQLEI